MSNDSLYVSYKKIIEKKSFLYYDSPGLQSSALSLLQSPCNHFADAFIKEYFIAAQKSAILHDDLGNLKLWKQLHSAFTYILGMSLHHLAKDELASFPLLKEINSADWHEFSYTWFLTSLFHDYGMRFENAKTLTDCFSRSDIQIKYNPFEFIKSSMNPMVLEREKYSPYKEDLISNYFSYRLKLCHCHCKCKCIDHGIVAGYLFFDRLKKNYNKAYSNYQRSAESDNTNCDYKNFTYKERSWRKEHLFWFAHIAQCIMAHNIWLIDMDSENCDIYKQYHLDELIGHEKISITKQPLLFFLGFIDSIEPVKRFSESTDAKQLVDVLKKISIQSKKHNIEIKFGNIKENYPCEFDTWIKSIYGMEAWLDVVVSPKNRDDILSENGKEISIMIKPEPKMA
jgi:hypothetical protein